MDVDVPLYRYRLPYRLAQWRSDDIVDGGATVGPRVRCAASQTLSATL